MSRWAHNNQTVGRETYMSTARSRVASNSMVEIEVKVGSSKSTSTSTSISTSTWGGLGLGISNSSNSASHKRNKEEESDEDLPTVPDVENRPMSTKPQIQIQKRRRGRNPVDKEYRRLKRLLRNRVSAQQARERKKVYVNELEVRAKELQDTNSKLEEKISTLINENTMLRKVLLNTRPKVDESLEQMQD